MDSETLTLSSPITDEQWDIIADVDFDGTDKILFNTKHGKDVEFVKQRTGRWILADEQPYFRKHFHQVCCSECRNKGLERWKYCPECGSYNGG